MRTFFSKKWQKRAALLLVILLTFSIVGCGNQETTQPSEETSPAPSAEKTEALYPVTLTDHLNREVTIEKEPETIVSGYYISTGILMALDQTSKLVGIEAKAETRPIYQLSAPELLDLPSVGTSKEFDLEGCAALNPDLIVLPVKLKDSIPALEDLGFTVLAVNPENQVLLEETITLLSTATNSTKKAKALTNFTEQNLALLDDALKDAPRPTVYLAGNSAFLSTAGEKMYQNQLITNAGGTNVAASLTDDYWAQISYEQLLAWNPEYIILASDADYGIDSVLNDPSLQDVQAVQNGHVYQFPNTIEAWDSPVPSSILGTLWLASVLHGDIYPEQSWQDSTIHFYNTFYHFDASGMFDK